MTDNKFMALSNPTMLTFESQGDGTSPKAFLDISNSQ